MRVAVPPITASPALPRLADALECPGPKARGIARVTGQHQSLNTQGRYAQFRHGPGIGPGPGLHRPAAQDEDCAQARSISTGASQPWP